MVDGLDSVYLVRPDAPDELAMQPECRESSQAQADIIRSQFRWPADKVREFYVSLV